MSKTEIILQDFVTGKITDERARIMIREIDPSFDFDAWIQED